MSNFNNNYNNKININNNYYVKYKNKNLGDNLISKELKTLPGDNNDTKDYKEVDNYLKTLTKNFIKIDNNNIESLNKAYYEKIEKKNSNKNNFKQKNIKKEEKAIFYDIFIKPKEDIINEIKEKQAFEKMQKEEDSSNKIKNNETILKPSYNLKVKSYFSNKMNNFINKVKNKNNNNSELDNILNYLCSKFITYNSESNCKHNFFNQLIQIKPPEGINAIVASPLMESKGWAPSIPSMQITKTKTTLSDLMLRAKGGIQPGDIPKEAHMAFYLGLMNEELKKYEEALKFYKKYFLSAKLLQDIYGTELALNRIGVIYSNILDYEQSLYYNDKHKDISTHNVNSFVAYFNSGLCNRMIGNIDDSIKNFNKALDYSNKESDLEAYVLCLCQLSISILFNKDFEKYKKLSNEFYEKNKILKHSEMEMEMLILSGYTYNFLGDIEQAYRFYSLGLENAINLDNEEFQNICLCNLGVLDANKNMNLYYNNILEEQSSYDAIENC